jgi:hypothetical protein
VSVERSSGAKGKWLELIKEMVTALKRVAVLRNATTHC